MVEFSNITSGTNSLTSDISWRALDCNGFSVEIAPPSSMMVFISERAIRYFMYVVIVRERGCSIIIKEERLDSSTTYSVF